MMIADENRVLVNGHTSVTEVHSFVVLRRPDPDNFEETKDRIWGKCHIIFKDGKFDHCTFPFSGSYTLEHWDILAQINEKIQEICKQKFWESRHPGEKYDPTRSSSS